MAINSSPDSAVDNITGNEALDHWTTGNGSSVYVNMQQHLIAGAGSVFTMESFAQSFYSEVADVDVGQTVRFETNSAVRAETGSSSAIASYTYYSEYFGFGVLTDNSYVWGTTSAGFRGTIQRDHDNVYIVTGEIRAFTEQFGFESNTWKPWVEVPRTIGGWLAGPGESGRRLVWFNRLMALVLVGTAFWMLVI